MEAAGAIRRLPAERRARNFERECERLRPLGEAYVMRRFSGQLGRADAEDAVADVLIRLHRRAEEGRLPDNLRAAFFTSVRNAAIDQLRSRSARPTVGLEAVAEAPAVGQLPSEHAESREDAVRLQEALGRMRGNYREAIVLRFGLGLTVPEIAEHLGISLPAAKKLVLRATQQVRKRMESIEGQEFCPEMRTLAQRSLLDKQVSGLCSDSEQRILAAHFEHCGSCRTFLSGLHQGLHDIGSGALFVGGASAGLEDKVGALDHVGNALGHAGEVLNMGAAKARWTAFKLTGAFQPGDAANANILANTGQKIAAICTAGAATTATCLATGVVGPGLGVGAETPSAAKPPAAKIKTLSETTTPAAPVVEEVPEPAPAPEPEPEPTPGSGDENGQGSESKPTAAPAPSPEEKAAQQSEAEFGIEGTPAPEPTPEPAPAPSPAPAAPAPSSSSSSSSSGGSSGGSGGSGTESFGFQG